MDVASAGPLQVRAVSVRGAAHRYEGSVRQDHYAYAVSTSQRWVVAVVCDGLGSKALSHVGAHDAATSTVDELAATIDAATDDVDELVRGAIGNAANAVHRKANVLGVTAERLSTTITVLAVHIDGKCLVASVGDSPAFRLTAGAFTTLDERAGGELTTSATACLPDHHTDVRIRWLQLQPGEAVFVASDGFAVPALTPDRQGYFARRWAHAPDSLDMLNDVNFLARSYDDDRTVVGCWLTTKDS